MTMRSWASLLFVSTVACSPSPQKVCDHLQSLDDQAPNPQRPYAGVQSKKTDSCVKQLNRLKSVDEAAYGVCAKCISYTDKWNDAWDCWVLDHHSPKQTEEIAKQVQCDKTCQSTLAACNNACQPMTDACSGKCADVLQPCVTRCQFE